MKHVRVELKLTAIVHVGSDVSPDGPAPTRDPDAVSTVVLSRVAHLGTLVLARDAAPAHFASIMADCAPVIAERLRHELREKGL